MQRSHATYPLALCFLGAERKLNNKRYSLLDIPRVASASASKKRAKKGGEEEEVIGEVESSLLFYLSFPFPSYHY